MLAKRIIPCLDVDQGRVVKGIRFVSLVDAGDPVEQGKRYDAEGADELTFLDITASSNTAAIEQPELISEGAETFGSQCMIVAVDARRRDAGDPSKGWEVYTHGGRRPVGLDAIEWITRAERLGAGEILLTSMDCDGTKDGYDIELTRTVSDSVRIPVIASGGAGRPEHFYEALTAGGASAVLAASLFHFGEYTIADVKNYLRERGVLVR